MTTGCSRRSSAACRCSAQRTSTGLRAPPAPELIHPILGAVIAGLALLGILVRPFRVNEAWWGAGGALALVVAHAITPRAAGSALLRGLDVYLFLVGMMALAGFARAEGVFDAIAARAVHAARGSRSRLLLLVYGAGVVTTAFLSNDATIVVLTPAVLAAMKRTDARPHAYVFACALVANAASFVLPIANPSNLLFFADGMPPLGAWLASFALASIASIGVTYAVLALVFRRDMAAALIVDRTSSPAPRTLAFGVLAVSAVVLVTTSSLSGPLGRVTFACGLAATALAATRERHAPLRIVSGIAWPVVCLTAALFVLVEALDAANAGTLPRALFAWAAHQAPSVARLGVALAATVASNLVNNLPVGLDLGRYVGATHPPTALNAAALVGVNVGPNLTANGSLATLLWLAILRREGVPIGPLRFAVVGLLAAPPALVAAALLAR